MVLTSNLSKSPFKWGNFLSNSLISSLVSLKLLNLFLNDVSIIFTNIGKNLFVFEASINSRESRKDIFIQDGADSLNSFNFVMVKIYEIKKTESNNLVLFFCGR